MTIKETSLINNGYGVDKKCNTQAEAEKRKTDHHSNGFLSQVIKRKENDQPFWFIYVKRTA